MCYAAYGYRERDTYILLDRKGSRVIDTYYKQLIPLYNSISATRSREEEERPKLWYTNVTKKEFSNLSLFPAVLPNGCLPQVIPV